MHISHLLSYHYLIVQKKKTHVRLYSWIDFKCTSLPFSGFRIHFLETEHSGGGRDFRNYRNAFMRPKQLTEDENVVQEQK